MIKKYRFDYDSNEAQVHFDVDTSKFTPELAKENLEFFLWDYDKEAYPIEEVMKKYAIEVVRLSSNNRSKNQIIQEFDNLEGFVKLDGSMGIKLTYVHEYEFTDDKLSKM